MRTRGEGENTDKRWDNLNIMESGHKPFQNKFDVLDHGGKEYL